MSSELLFSRLVDLSINYRETFWGVENSTNKWQRYIFLSSD
jgi:hypothetical protein